MIDISSQLNVSLQAASSGRFGSEWRRGPGRDPYTRFYLIRDGGAVVSHHGRTYQMRPGWMYVIPAESEVAFHCPDHFEVAWIHCDATLSGGVDFFQWLPGEYEWEVEDIDVVSGWFDQLEGVFGGKRLADQLTIKGILLRLMALYVERVDLSPRVSRRLDAGRRFEAVSRRVETLLPGRVRVTELARVAGMEATYFATAFKNCFGMSPRDYVASKRVELVIALLLEGDLTLGEIAERCGYCDAYHLSKSFKSRVGMAPSEYRHQRRLALSMP